MEVSKREKTMIVAPIEIHERTSYLSSFYRITIWLLITSLIPLQINDLIHNVQVSSRKTVNY